MFGAAGVDASQGEGEGGIMRVDESVSFPDEDMVGATAASGRTESVCPIIVVMAAAVASRI